MDQVKGGEGAGVGGGTPQRVPAGREGHLDRQVGHRAGRAVVHVR